MKRKLFILLLAITGLVLAGCGGGISEFEAGLGEEFSLSTGESAIIKGENLKITFLEVLGDSRCPKNVTCIWAGQATCRVRLISNGTIEKVELTEPGLSDQHIQQVYQDYQLSFRLLPYPESDKEITPGEYYLLLTISKLK